MKISALIHYFLVFCSVSLIIVTPNPAKGQCTGSGSIISSGSGSLGDPAILDPDSDGDIIAGGSTFTGCTDELAEFEPLTNSSGCSTCQIPWTAVNNSDSNNDLWSSGGCDKTDVIGDDDNGNTFAYFTIIDPDGTCDSGDELIVFRLRIAADFTGAFSYGFLTSNDGLLGEDDPDGIVCCSKLANSGFEYEVQLKTGGSGSGVNVIDVDGLAGSDNCGASPDPCISYSIANNSQKSTACGSVCACRSSGGDPQFLTFFVGLADIGATCSTYTNLSFVPVTSNSPNPVLSDCASVSDVGGAAELDSLFVSCPACEGVSYTGCTAAISEQGCALACTAEANSFLTALPIELKSIQGLKSDNKNVIIWETISEINSDYFVIERSRNGMDDFEEIGTLASSGNEFEGKHYEFEDFDLASILYYRIKFVDLDRSYEYSNTVAIQRPIGKLELVNIYPVEGSHIIEYVTPSKSKNVKIFIRSLNGTLVKVLSDIQTGDHQSITIPTNIYPRGLYFISITEGNRLITKRVVF